MNSSTTPTAFFHSFAADEYMIGFVFADEREAKTFWKKVTIKKVKACEARTLEAPAAVAPPPLPAHPTIAASRGPPPYVAHMGYNEESGFTPTGVDPSWAAFLGQLENSGIDKQIIAQEMDFIKDYVR
ncbi:hypothetical protein B0H19DRAFT_1297135, partial [Mycena capillaripes]